MNKHKLIEHRLLREQERNQVFLKQEEGKPVMYNENVHLIHAQSGLFLDTFSETAEHHSFSVHLCSHVSQSSVFRLLPLYNIKTVSEKVQINDRFRIKNIKTGYFLNYSSHKGYQSFLDLNVSQGINKEKSVFEYSQSSDELNSCAVILAEQGIVWNSKLVRRFGWNEGNQIVSHSLVRIRFPHFESEMCADLSYIVKKSDSGRQRQRGRGVLEEVQGRAP